MLSQAESRPQCKTKVRSSCCRAWNWQMQCVRAWECAAEGIQGRSAGKTATALASRFCSRYRETYIAVNMTNRRTDGAGRILDTREVLKQDWAGQQRAPQGCCPDSTRPEARAVPARVGTRDWFVRGGKSQARWDGITPGASQASALSTPTTPLAPLPAQRPKVCLLVAPIDSNQHWISGRITTHTYITDDSLRQPPRSVCPHSDSGGLFAAVWR